MRAVQCSIRIAEPKSKKRNKFQTNRHLWNNELEIFVIQLLAKRKNPCSFLQNAKPQLLIFS